MTREPDRFNVQACAVVETWNAGASGLSDLIAAALRQAADEALGRAAYIAESYGCDYAGKEIRALASPAAAPAPEPERFFPGAAELMGNPPSEPVAPSLLPRVLAALESYADLTQSTTLDREIRALAAELRRYIAEMEAGPASAREMYWYEQAHEAWRARDSAVAVNEADLKDLAATKNRADAAEKRIAELEGLLRDIEKTLAGHRERDGASPVTVSEIVLKIVRKVAAARSEGET